MAIDYVVIIRSTGSRENFPAPADFDWRNYPRELNGWRYIGTQDGVPVYAEGD